MSSKFLDGPAAGQMIELRNPTIMLRVVRAADGTWDALDMPEDVAREDETVFVYRATLKPITVVHVDYRDKQGRRCGKWHQDAEYRVLPDPPCDEILRKLKLWREWCDLNKDRLLAGRAES